MSSSVEQHIHKRFQAVSGNIGAKGHRLLAHLNLAMLTCTIAGLVAFWAESEMTTTCETNVVDLSTWFRCLALIEIFSGLQFATIHFGVATLLKRLVGQSGVSAGREDGTPAPPQPAVLAPQSSSAYEPRPAPQPGPAPAPAPAPAPPPGPGPPQPLPTTLNVCLVYLILFSTVMMAGLAGLLALWSLFGVIAAMQATSCDSGLVFAWALSIGGLVQTCCCHISSFADTHVPSEVRHVLDDV